MAIQLPDFSKEQWDFLAFLDIFGAPISIDLAVSIVPLDPVAFLDLIERGIKKGLIEREESEIINISKILTVAVKAKLEKLNNPKHISTWLERLESSGKIGSLNPADLIPLYSKAGKDKKALDIEMTLGIEAVGNDQWDAAIEFFRKALARRPQISGDNQFESKVVRSTLEYSDLCFTLGKEWKVLPTFLERALKGAQRLGDNRSIAMIHFHLGRVQYFANQRAQALISFSQGHKAVKELGDFDIQVRSAEFLGLYYFMQGLPKKAIKHFERVVQDIEYRGKNQHIKSMTIILTGYCAVYLGQFHKAIGFLDYHWRLALEKSDRRQAATIRATLGTVLVLIGRIEEGSYHLTRSEKEGTSLDNRLAIYLAKGGLSYCEFLRGRTEAARHRLAELFTEGKRFGMVHQYASPFMIEMLFEFKRLGFEDLPEMPFQKEVDRIMADPNIHTRGVALRLQARLAAANGGDKEKLRADLQDSEDYLKHAEDPVQLAMTWLEMSRLKLEEGKKEEASLLAKKARLGLAGFGNDFFPDDFRHLLKGGLEISHNVSVSSEGIINRFLDMMEELFPIGSGEDLLSSTVVAINQLFQAERGGLFWVGDGKQQGTPQLRAGCNLSASEVKSADFRTSLQMIRKVAKSGEAIMIRPTSTNSKPDAHGLKTILCFPIEVEGSVVGVLYHDNSYLTDCFDFSDRSLIEKLVHQITNYIRRIQAYSQCLETTNNSMELMRKDTSDDIELLTRSSTMIQTLSQADQIASSESTVLIYGETGVGKELLAKRIHLSSSRRKGPFVVVDMTTVPENLVESELFGHEKGSFTGADRQVKGRFELANGGTLFIDEIGEASQAVQTKLLRVIQEKMFYRVGGTREIKSDFRLLSATNRDLTADVAAGCFRKDLYYRLNTMPLTIPPLRERGKDVTMLASYFLGKFAKKYNYAKPKLSSQDKKRLMDYSWPGNVRELKNVIERAVVMSNMGEFEFAIPSSQDSETKDIIADNPSFDELQRRYFKIVLEKTDDRVSGKGGAAEWLGMPRTTLNARLKKLGLR